MARSQRSRLSASAAFLAASALVPAVARDPAAPAEVAPGHDPYPSPAARSGPAPSGEPYELATRRLAFTSWRYVRPGSFAWVDVGTPIILRFRLDRAKLFWLDFEG